MSKKVETGTKIGTIVGLAATTSGAAVTGLAVAVGWPAVVLGTAIVGTCAAVGAAGGAIADAAENQSRKQ